MKKKELIETLCLIGFKYSSVLSKANISMIFSYINFLLSFDDLAEIPVSENITEIINTYVV